MLNVLYRVKVITLRVKTCKQWIQIIIERRLCYVLQNGLYNDDSFLVHEKYVMVYKNYGEVLRKLKSRGLRATNLSTYDFRLYIPHYPIT